MEKIRVSAGYERDPDTVWTVEKVRVNNALPNITCHKNQG